VTYLRYLCLFGSSLPPVVLRRVHDLFTLFVFVWFEWCRCVFVLSFFSFLYPRLPVSLDCPCLITPSVFSNVYINLFWSFESKGECIFSFITTNIY
jgi:hypothetical protein